MLSLLGSAGLPGHACGGQLHRLKYFYVAGAAADVAGKRFLDPLAGEGCGVTSNSAFAVSRSPGVQYPHWAAPSSANASCSGWSFVPSARPSTVVTSCSFHGDPQRQAGKHRTAIQQHGATSALPQFAAMFGAGQPQVLAKDFEERLMRGKRLRRGGVCPSWDAPRSPSRGLGADRHRTSGSEPGSADVAPCCWMTMPSTLPPKWGSPWKEHEVTTVEGLADGTKLHPLQEAFAELGAAQSGQHAGTSADGKSAVGGYPTAFSREREKKRLPVKKKNI